MRIVADIRQADVCVWRPRLAAVNDPANYLALVVLDLFWWFGAFEVKRIEGASNNFLAVLVVPNTLGEHQCLQNWFHFVGLLCFARKISRHENRDGRLTPYFLPAFPPVIRAIGEKGRLG